MTGSWQPDFCTFVYLCIYIFVYLYICVFMYLYFHFRAGIEKRRESILMTDRWLSKPPSESQGPPVKMGSASPSSDMRVRWGRWWPPWKALPGRKPSWRWWPPWWPPGGVSCPSLPSSWCSWEAQGAREGAPHSVNVSGGEQNNNVSKVGCHTKASHQSIYEH